MALEDVLYPFLNLYHRSPFWFKHFVGYFYRIIPNQIKYGKFYNEYANRIIRFQKLNKAETQQETEKLLIKNVNQAINNIEFYKNYKAIKSIDDFQNLPIITKDVINSNRSLFLNNKKQSYFLKANTGGSSGTPFTFYIHKGKTRPKEKAHFDWYWGNNGYQKGKPILMIRGKSLKNNKAFEYNSLDNKLILNCNLINEATIHKINKKISSFKPEFIHAYPSSLSIFTKVYKAYVNSNKFALNVNTVYLGSEGLSDIDLNNFKLFYNANIVNWYGHSECLAHAGRDAQTGNFEFHSFYGYVELLDENDNVITSTNKIGKIIATGFDNEVMPLVRYDTGDFGEISDVNEFQNSAIVILKNIEGRDKSVIYLKDGTEVSLTSLIFGEHHKEFEFIKEIQIIQNKLGEIFVHIVQLKEMSEKEIKGFKKSLQNKVAVNTLDVTIKVVEKIKKTPRGKHILLLQNLK
ncbi:hypothetical protein A9Q86_00790 [Flavobacteriales bacterium 33_180_T64]|nr:hypothetical protein A9Q86_00790 [Flavobacteriales bacterium 33_180_T64]